MRLTSLTTFGGASTTTVTLTAISVAAAALIIGAAVVIAGAYSGNSGSGATSSSGNYVGAPASAAGMGLPGIIVVGCGAYWLVRRHRRKSDTGVPRGDLKD
jgi:hypothetical protein